MRAVEAGDLVVERHRRVAWVTFNRPDARNAMTFDMYDDLHDLCEQLDGDPDVRVVVVRGAGDKSFAAGTDIPFTPPVTPSQCVTPNSMTKWAASVATAR